MELVDNIIPIEVEDEIADIGNEAQIISALVSDNFSRNEILVRLNASDFVDQDYRIIFNTVKELQRNDNDIDYSIVIQSLQQSDIEDKHEVISKLIQAVSDYPVIDNLSTHLKVLINKSTKLKLERFAKNLIDTKIDYLNAESQFDKIQSSLIEIINSRNLDEMKPIKEYIDEFNAKLEHIKENQGKLTGTTSGFKDIDRITNGFQPGDLIILAARPSIGKTALALNFLINAAKNLDKNEKEVVVMFSLEMGIDQLLQRMICNVIPLSGEILRQGNWDPEVDFSIHHAIEKIGNMNILVDDKSNVTILDIQAKLQQIAKTNKIKLVVIDYLQLIETSSKNANRVQEVGKISRTLKILAKDLKIPIIAIAQLSRKIEERKGEDRKPMLSDLRESGSIEQDADLVTFIDYQRDEIDEEQSRDGIKKYKTLVTVNFHIEKHRNGSTGTVQLHFNKQTGQYLDLRHDKS